MDMIRGNELSRMHALARKAAMPMMDDVILPDMEACCWYREHYGKGVFFRLSGMNGHSGNNAGKRFP